MNGLVLLAACVAAVYLVCQWAPDPAEGGGL